METKLLIEDMFSGQVLRFTLNAPKANILDAAMMAELQGALDGLRATPGVKLLLFQGAGDHFCFGASVEEHTRENAPQMLASFHALFYTLAELNIPTAAVVSGQCLGGGMELALVCNVILADRSARFGQPEIVLGVFPPPASILLPLKVGRARAEELLLTGRSITADEAHTAGLVAQVFDDRATLDTGVDAWIRKHILSKSASSLRYAVRAARLQFNNQLREHLGALEALYIDDLMATHDANEGIAAFMEKRQAVWTDD